MKKAIFLFGLIFAIMLAQGVSAVTTTVVPEVYKADVIIDVPTVVSCNIKENWDKEAGACSYLNIVHMIVPAYQNQLIANALQKGKVPVTDNPGPYTLSITFIPPPRGEKYVVTTFLVETKYTLVSAPTGATCTVSTDCVSGDVCESGQCINRKWTYETIIAGVCKNVGADGIPGTTDDVCTTTEQWYKAMGYKPTVEAIIGVCEEGKLVIPTSLGDMCVLAKPVCWDTQGVNYCTAKDIFCLDINRNGIIDEDCTNAVNLCMDAQGATGGGPDGICDMKRAIASCTDVIPAGGDGICDVDDAYAAYSCDDANQNGICDDVEVSGVICPLVFQPVCNEVTWTTYPNSCFADGLGVTYRDGLCEPIDWQCDTYADCPMVPGCIALAEIRTCTEHQCGFSGGCALQQCDASADNPTEFCPPAPCVGVSVSCSSDTNTCMYEGKCIEKPDQMGLDWWAELGLIWNNFWYWVINDLLAGG